MHRLIQGVRRSQGVCRSAQRRNASTNATVEGTSSFFRSQSSPLRSVQMARTGLHMSRLVYGGDALGEPVPSRAMGLLNALQSGVCNTLAFNLTEQGLRRELGSMYYTKDDTSQLWEGHVLQEALARGTVSRQQLILVGTVVLAEEVGAGAPASAAAGTPLSQLPKLVADAQFWMGLEGGFDVLMVQLPPAMHSDALPSLVRTMEAAVDAGLARSYGVAAPRFTALSSGGDATPSLRRLFSAAELYNPKHRLSCVSYNCSLGEVHPFQNAFVDPRGKEASLCSLARSYGMTQLARRPFNVEQNDKCLRTVEQHLPDSMTGSVIAKAVSEALNQAIHLEIGMGFAALLSQANGVAALPVEQDLTWARVLAAGVNDMDSLAEWIMCSSYGVSRSVERVTQFAMACGNEDTKEWAFTYRLAMLQLMRALTDLHAFHHTDQMRSVKDCLEIALGKATSLPVEALTAQLLLDSGMDCIASEVPGLYSGVLGTKATGYEGSGLTAVQSTDVLSRLVLPTLLRPQTTSQN